MTSVSPSALSGVVVVGSANLDEVVSIPHHPAAGETVLGGTLTRSPGGKGANQAVASARAGGMPTSFIGAVGEDQAGEILLSSLQDAGVRTHLVQRVPGASGIALITVSPDGENAIVVAPGANEHVRIDRAEREEIGRAGAVLAQLEIPIQRIVQAAQARSAGSIMILNAAPSAPLPAELWNRLDVLIVNEHEALDLVHGAGRVEDAAKQLGERVAGVIVTLASDGCIVLDRASGTTITTRLSGIRVDAVDTTGAGDAFCGVVAARMADGASLTDAALIGAAAGALTVTRSGAQDAVPTAQELDEFLAEVTATE